jgi:Family of unknown function (DUF5670)
MIHMYGIHRMRKRNVVRYPFHVLDSDSFAEPVGSGTSVLFLTKGVIMLWTIFVILLILWFLGMVSSYTLAGYIHILLLIAVVVLIINLITGRRGAI